MKHLVYFILALASVGCQRPSSLIEHQAVGYAQGTTFQIKYLAQPGRSYQPSFDSIFSAIDQSMSTWTEGSLINRINAAGGRHKVDPLFAAVLQRSLEIAEETNGAFDPTVGPLVSTYGFNKNSQRDVDSARIDSLRNYVGYRQLSFDDPYLYLPEGFNIDFNAIAQGYTVDVIAQFMEDKGIDRYMVEVGGEVRARGTNARDKVWRIGVDKPQEEIDENERFEMILALKDKSLATSGNYRKFWTDTATGIRYAHTIDPGTGYPARNRLLSVSVIANTCMDADAYATACMVMGTEKALEFLATKDDLQAYLVSSGEDGEWEVHQTLGFADFIVD